MHGFTKRCPLSWLTNSAPVYEPKCGGRGGVAGCQPMNTAVHMEPKQTLEIQLHIKPMMMVHPIPVINELKNYKNSRSSQGGLLLHQCVQVHHIPVT
jgi:hypothetical protein